MQTGYISFCGSVAFNIKTEQVKKNILKNIEQLANIKIIQRHFDVLNKNHFKKLNDNPHLISLKTNGNPYLLFLTKYNFINQSIFIDKKIQSGYFLPRMIISHFEFDESLYENTLLDGEMVKDKDNKWIFIINDIYIYKNQSLQNINIFKRLNNINEIFSNFNNIFDSICNFQLKKYFKYTELKYMIEEYKKTLNYTCRGIYFKPLYFKFKNILYNFDDSLICQVNKVKYQNKNEFILNNNTNINNSSYNNNTNNNNTNDNNTNDNNTNDKKIKINDNNESENNKLEKKIYYIEMTDMSDIYNLYTMNEEQKEYNLQNVACIPNIETSNFVRNIFENKNFNIKLKVNCEYIKKFNKWKPIELIN